MRYKLVACVAIILALTLQGCGASWETTLIGADGSPVAVNRQALKALMAEEAEALPVDAVLYSAGYELVASVTVTGTTMVSQLEDRLGRGCR